MLYDRQVNLAPTTSEFYAAEVLLIQTPQGLSGAGTIAVSWHPDTDQLTIHKLAIQRAGKEIDVLASGQTFSVLRRESGLEYASLSGTLTAVMQPEGLQVGDRIEFTYTLRRTEPLLGGVPEEVMGIPAGAVIGQVHLRARWPSDYRMTWRASLLDGVEETRVGNFTEVSISRTGEVPLVQPVGAPARFAAVRMVQLSGHKSWDAISRLLFPLFEEAARLPADSGLQAELARIKAATTDQKARAQAALRLVQDQIRYVYLGMNDARIVPADIKTTWTRRYGDCKAKTAMLLALLRGLGITAEPVLVSSVAGDALPTRLPMIGMFDHVLVRATIGGKTYWLDGTRSGDRLLDDLPVPTFRWGLPLRAAGAGLLEIEPVPPASPIAATTIVIDASDDPAKAVRFTAEILLRGEGAIATQQSISALADNQRDTALRTYWTRQSYWKNNWVEVNIQAARAEFDDARGQMRLSMEGEGIMNWQGDQHLAGELSLGDVVDFKRQPGPNSDAPYLVPFPVYETVQQRIKLPRAGAGFSIVGENIDRTIAGTQYRRNARIANGEFIAETSRRSVRVEFPSSDAPEAQKVLREIWDDPMYVALPKEAAPAVSQAGNPGDPVRAYIDRGISLESRRMHEQAMVEFNHAVELDGTDSRGWAFRGRLYLEMGRRSEAGADLRKALQLNPENTTAISSLGALAQEEGRTQEAIDMLSRALQIEDESWTRLRRVDAYLAARDVRRAAQDLAALARANPDLGASYFEGRARTLMTEQRFDDIDALGAAALEEKAGPANGVVIAARLKRMTGSLAEVKEMLTEAIERSPSADLYTERANTTGNEDAAAADLEKALELDPKHVRALETYAFLRTFRKQYPEALQLVDRLEAVAGPSLRSRKIRADVFSDSGDIKGARNLFSAMRAESQAPEALMTLCRLELDFAASELVGDGLRDCDAGLAAKPGDAALLGTRGLVLLKLRRYEESMAAFTSAIAASAAGSQSMAEALYGRGLAKSRLGKTSEVDADIQAARRAMPAVELIFSGFGLGVVR
jgi:tetratricopeptide (TPR) repeat protein/transglutaminase-like putative cysteine protease